MSISSDSTHALSSKLKFSGNISLIITAFTRTGVYKQCLRHLKSIKFQKGKSGAWKCYSMLFMSEGRSQTTIKLALWVTSVAHYLNEVMKTKIDREVCFKFNENSQSLSRHGTHKNEDMIYLLILSFDYFSFFQWKNKKKNESKIWWLRSWQILFIEWTKFINKSYLLMR